MRVIREQHPEEIKNYEHIKPAPTFGPVRCFAKLPGTPLTCTLAKQHPGPHVAHGWRKKVMAVWNE
jgi:hypothetical protein